ncbi:MAG: phosphatidylserine decarboxylase [Bacteroidia bacterium]|nr:phosphatidylserine decarboxylase [Bacteroidia bacterium]MDW8134051.1 phosphatidylserine decarboxylase [Bacteroidia bacterium]
MGIVRFHREGYFWIAFTIGVGLIGALGLVFWSLPAWVGGLLGGLWGLWMVGILNFFRYPLRVCPSDPNVLYAPCDGKVVEVKRTFEPKYFHVEMQQISIFMSPLDVHVNWAPAEGTVKVLQHRPGLYMVAWHPKASLLNEQTFLAVVSVPEERFYALRQIAGILARRISTYPQVGHSLRAGEEIGFIKFGSRVDVLVPLSAHLCVSVGMRVKGAYTPIAFWGEN